MHGSSFFTRLSICAVVSWLTRFGAEEAAVGSERFDRDLLISHHNLNPLGLRFIPENHQNLFRPWEIAEHFGLLRIALISPARV